MRRRRDFCRRRCCWRRPESRIDHCDHGNDGDRDTSANRNNARNVLVFVDVVGGVNWCFHNRSLLRPDAHVGDLTGMPIKRRDITPVRGARHLIWRGPRVPKHPRVQAFLGHMAMGRCCYPHRLGRGRRAGAHACRGPQRTEQQDKGANNHRGIQRVAAIYFAIGRRVHDLSICGRRAKGNACFRPRAGDRRLGALHNGFEGFDCAPPAMRVRHVWRCGVNDYGAGAIFRISRSSSN